MQGIIEKDSQTISENFNDNRMDIAIIDNMLLSACAELNKIKELAGMNPKIIAELVSVYQVKIEELKRIRKDFYNLIGRVYESVSADVQTQNMIQGTNNIYESYGQPNDLNVAQMPYEANQMEEYEQPYVSDVSSKQAILYEDESVQQVVDASQTQESTLDYSNNMGYNNETYEQEEMTNSEEISEEVNNFLSGILSTDNQNPEGQAQEINSYRLNKMKHDYGMYDEETIEEYDNLLDDDSYSLNDDLFDDEQDSLVKDDNQQLSDISYDSKAYSREKITNENTYEEEHDDYEILQINNPIKESADVYKKSRPTIQYEDEFKKNSFNGKNNIEIEIVSALCKKGIYTIKYNKTENGKTIKDLKKTVELSKEYLNKRYLEKEFKKKNKPSLLELLENNEIEFNLSYFLKEEFDKKFGTQIDQSYKNNKLYVEYDLRDILSWKSIGKGAAINLYRIALNQEKLGNAKILHSKFVLSIVKLMDKLKQDQRNISSDKVKETVNNITNVKKDSNTMSQSTKIENVKKNKSSKEKSKVEQELGIKNTWDTLSAVRAGFGQNHLNDNNSVQENNAFSADYSDDSILAQKNNIGNKKYNNFFTKTNVRIATVATILLSIFGVGKMISNNKDKNIDSFENTSISSVIDLDGLMKGNTKLAENTENTECNYNPEVSSVLTLVQRDGSGNITREYPLSSDKFDEGEKFAASKCKGDLFKISSIIIYNKDSKETIDTISDKGINAKSLYGKYGADIGIDLCLNACDENFNVIDEKEYHLNYDNYSRFGDTTKQKLAERYSKHFAEENEQDKTTENNTSESTEEDKNIAEAKTAKESSEPTKEPAKSNESDYQNQASYVDSNNNANLLYKDANGNITDVCMWTGDSDGSGTIGSAKYLDCDSYKFSLVVALNKKNEYLGYIDVEIENISIEQAINKLQEKYGSDIKIVYNFNGYKDGKLTDKNLGFVSKEKYDSFNAEKPQSAILSEDDRFNRDIENTLAQNEIFKGYKLTLHM